jgi:hypothetical protein
MTVEARRILFRVMWRLSHDHAATLAEVEERRQTGKSIAMTLTWKTGTYEAWKQIRTLYDFGQVVDPWKKSPLRKEQVHVP